MQKTASGNPSLQGDRGQLADSEPRIAAHLCLKRVFAVIRGGGGADAYLVAGSVSPVASPVDSRRCSSSLWRRMRVCLGSS